MSRKANSEIAEEFIAYLHAQRLEVFKETHVIGETLHHEFLYIAPAGQKGESTSLHELCQTLLPWLQANGISKSHEQIEHIARLIWSSAEDRTHCCTHERKTR